MTSGVMPALRTAGFFGIRVPLLPVTELLTFADTGEAAFTSDGAASVTRSVEAAGANARRRRRLQELLARPEVREALLIASPDLVDAMQRWIEGVDPEKQQRVERSLYKYLTRMASRATPFGLFSAVGYGVLGDKTDLSHLDPTCRRRVARLDMGVLDQIVSSLLDHRELREQLTYRANETIVRVGDRLHYIEVKRSAGSRAYELASVIDSAELQLILTLAASHATFAELTRAIVSEEIDDESAAEFLHELIDSGMLIATLGPAVTGEDALKGVATALAATTHTAAGALAAVSESLERLNALPLGVTADAYEEIRSIVPSLDEAPSLARMFQVDSMLSSTPSLGSDVVAEASRAARFLLRLGSPPVFVLDTFRQAFEARYDREEVPLLQLLDSEIGLGFPEEDPSHSGGRQFATREAELTRLLVEAARTGQREIEVTDASLALLAFPGAPADPAGIALVATLQKSSIDGEAERGFDLVVNGAVGPSAALWFGRFCHADERICAAVRELLTAEEQAAPDTLHAEIVHLPEGRTGNVLFRPLLRRYEIPLLGDSGMDDDGQIPLSDLVVAVRDGRLVLKSVRHNREVLPCLTNAHNIDWGAMLPLYRFLGRLRHQGVKSALGWSWGSLSSQPFLPRVRYGRSILSRAQWTITTDQLGTPGERSLEARLGAVARMRETLSLPRFVTLADGDQAHLTDLDNALSIEVFLDLVKGRPSFTLTEALPEPGGLAAVGTGEAERYAHELVIPFLVTGDSHRNTASASPATVRTVSRALRQRIPGSDWLYVKLYGGQNVADDILLRTIVPVAHAAVGKGAASRWFFLRYADPLPHLRVRFNGPPDRLFREVLPMLHEALHPDTNTGRISRVVVDTYEREIERYGGADALHLVEDIFFHDSVCAADIVNASASTADSVRRFVIGFASVDRLLSDLGFDTLAKKTLGTRLSAVSTALKREWSSAYRTQREVLEKALIGQFDGEITDDVTPMLDRRSVALQAPISGLRQLESEGLLWVPVHQIAESLVHMHVNRVHRANQPFIETQYYDALWRTHASALARELSAARLVPAEA